MTRRMELYTDRLYLVSPRALRREYTVAAFDAVAREQGFFVLKPQGS